MHPRSRVTVAATGRAGGGQRPGRVVNGLGKEGDAAGTSMHRDVRARSRIDHSPSRLQPASCSRGLQACSQRAAHVVLACTWRRAVSSPRSLRCYLYVVCRAHAEVHALACCRPSAGAPEVRRRKRTMYSCGSLVGLEVVFAGACVCANRTPAPVIVQRARARVRVREEERRRGRCTLAMVSTMRCD